jgi:hypothetical protein
MHYRHKRSLSSAKCQEFYNEWQNSAECGDESLFENGRSFVFCQ